MVETADIFLVLVRKWMGTQLYCCTIRYLRVDDYNELLYLSMHTMKIAIVFIELAWSRGGLYKEGGEKKELTTTRFELSPFAR